MFEYRPAPTFLARHLAQFKTRILANDYRLSRHANKRMVQRGVSIDEILAAVAHGLPCKSGRRQDWISGAYFHEGLFILMAAPFGDRAAQPVVVTVFRDHQAVDVDLDEELADVFERGLREDRTPAPPPPIESLAPALQNLLRRQPAAQPAQPSVSEPSSSAVPTTSVALAGDLSIEQLEGILAAKKTEVKRRDEEALRARRAALADEMKALEGPMTNLRAQLADIDARLSTGRLRIRRTIGVVDRA